MPRRSAAFQRIILVLAALAVLGAAAWAAQQVFEPVPVPPFPPPKARVSFDTRKDIRGNALFQTLQGYVTGVIEPGVLGRPNPFVGPVATGTTAGATGGAGLGVAEEISLGGSGVIALRQAPDGSMLALLEGKRGADAVYEVRRYKTDGVVDSPVTWTVPGGPVSDAITPASFAEGSDDTFWFVSAAGHVAKAVTGSMPTWSAAPLMALNGESVSMRVDAADRIWVTDGHTVYNGDGISFTTTDLVSLLPIDTAYAQDPELLNPNMIQVLAGGRFGVLTAAIAYTLPLASSQSPIVYSLLPTSTGGMMQGIAMGQTPEGGLLYVPSVAGPLLALVSSSGTKTYDDPYTVPTRVLSQAIERTATDGNALYALDYSSTSTILWKLIEESWTANVIAASGTLPNDVPVQVEPDGAGNVWVQLKQRGLLRVSPPKRP
ncbi:hypothetical protein A3E39_04775 [Candidatus Uhrbacteria bacterium RIFCSPHIGHO2_12_FULL_60_25]|uniref:Uncharacterized protein n=1 Tax=Candidatus Uhrbacteria bacterium RIFCSPHIGHO2_12_FULL_60_25 TaxID=1802399 RepID=A0A1F7ULP6_9BACT|nr:MAG: hypothetical protein A3D73_01170 [Candidatus Uhrbacteria bacterium RIFCSPHIGHO2_02_FULL_60_44]OGL79189.1 MAG: hypothetical protein A3E39_04775 [Candidatus Uhrbacteria bacterium RIFCSPHIGHO2_12_FULL_60_25]